MAKDKKTSEAPDDPRTALWNELRSTPEEYLKKFTRTGGFSGKSIDPVYRIRRLTERFGPCGKGWGFVQEDQWSDIGSGVYCVYVRGHLWYKLDGDDEVCKTCSHTGGTDASRVPDEAYKMAETDALGKCCVDIGLAVDVYMGEHDGDKYQTPDSAPRHNPNAAAAGKRPAGNNPTNTGQAPTGGGIASKPIVEAEVKNVLDIIAGVKDEVDALACSKVMYKRLLVTTTLPPEQMAVIGERMIAKRCEFATASQLKNLNETVDAYAKKWVSLPNAKKQLELVKRRLGIPPDQAPAGSLPLE